MLEKSSIRLIRNKPDPFSKESREVIFAEFNLGDLTSICNYLGLDSKKEIWLRLPKNVEPGDCFEVLLNGLGTPFLAEFEPSILPNPKIFVSDDLHVWPIE